MSKQISFKKVMKEYKKYCKDNYKQSNKKFYKNNFFHKEDSYNMDSWFYINVLVRLCYLRDNHVGVPAKYIEFDEAGRQLSTIEDEDKQYIKDLNYIITYFYIAYKDTYWINATDEEISAMNGRIKKARKMFVKILPFLWS